MQSLLLTSFDLYSTNLGCEAGFLEFQSCSLMQFVLRCQQLLSISRIGTLKAAQRIPEEGSFDSFF